VRGFAVGSAALLGDFKRILNYPIFSVTGGADPLLLTFFRIVAAGAAAIAATGPAAAELCPSATVGLLDTGSWSRVYRRES
jgi:hypothetical protein